MSLRYGLKLVFATWRGMRIFLSSFLAAFGLISAVVQFVGQLFPSLISRPGLVTLSAFVLCVGGGLARAYPSGRIRREFKQPEIAVTVVVGDLFQQDGHIVVGFTDTFDTSTTGNRVISRHSVQGQLAERRYGGDRRRLDREISAALSRHTPHEIESRGRKAHGKLRRFRIGTVAVIGKPPRLVFAVAYSRMGNDFVARSSVDDIWMSLGTLWDAIYSHAQHGRVAIPLIGSGLARVDMLERQNLLRMILLSFLARSRQGVVCRELRIVIWPADLELIDMLEVEAFLRTL
ncbi:macro domain-containing protein [Phytohabitans suffuscus]|uniref:Thoeris protein ThsA Macro domain-containing protein n=1 Tax=Phytohabitans suffuscus TaxID=624315 RepID=A0A6F8YDG1_9ACTN|nr:macro domain-containing protein [Phytohabitans suffuscus]BCB84100.1 hypothetical protein Psuf_014130 [Phytohabitans suffuscus]